MIVIQVHDNDIGLYKILIGAIALPVLRADVVKRHGSAELFFAVDHHLAWIAAVLLIADAIGAVKCNLHFIAHLSQKDGTHVPQHTAPRRHEKFRNNIKKSFSKKICDAFRKNRCQRGAVR